MTRLLALLASTALLLALAGCGVTITVDPPAEDTTPSGPTAACLDAMQALDDAPADADEEEVVKPLYAATLNECTTQEEWLAALTEYPGALLLRDASFVSEDLFESSCIMFPDTVACGS